MGVRGWSYGPRDLLIFCGTMEASSLSFGTTRLSGKLKKRNEFIINYSAYLHFPGFLMQYSGAKGAAFTPLVTSLSLKL